MSPKWRGGSHTCMAMTFKKSYGYLGCCFISVKLFYVPKTGGGSHTCIAMTFKKSYGYFGRCFSQKKFITKIFPWRKIFVTKYIFITKNFLQGKIFVMIFFGIQGRIWTIAITYPLFMGSFNYRLIFHI